MTQACTSCPGYLSGGGTTVKRMRAAPRYGGRSPAKCKADPSDSAGALHAAAFAAVAALCLLGPYTMMTQAPQLVLAIVVGVAYIYYRPLQAALRPQQTHASCTARKAEPATVDDARQALHADRQYTELPRIPAAVVSRDFERQIDNLVYQILPSPASNEVIQQLANNMQDEIKKIFPEASVLGFASGDMTRGSAFSVAVPGVSIVVNISPQELAQKMQERLFKSGPIAMRLDARKVQKCAVRVCTDALVSNGGFRFRRSAFCRYEPKVTLLTPVELGAIPIDFSVNSTAPFHNAALLAECGQIDTRAVGLIFLVKRWAKDRGLCHEPRDSLPSYAWTLLTIYFLQVGVSGEALLPPLRGVITDSGPVAVSGSISSTKSTQQQPAEAATKHVAALFVEFINFYLEAHLQQEVISIRSGRRETAGSALMRRVKFPNGHSTQNQRVQGMLVIEDPFDTAKNVGAYGSSAGAARFKEELGRAHVLLCQGAPLAKVLEPWAPGTESSRQSSTSETRFTDGGDEEVDDVSWESSGSLEVLSRRIARREAGAATQARPKQR